MFPILNILATLPWRLIAASAFAAALFAGGYQFGANRVTAKWDAEKVTTGEAVSKQAEHVAAVTVQQSTINQEISNDFQKAKTAINADRPHLLARVPVRVRVDATDHSDPLSAVPDVATRTDAATADPVPVAAACEKLAEDAAQTTLMVVEFQRWYREQREAMVNSRLKLHHSTPR